ncbi:MAG: caspase family protein [Ignavibacteriaceae bacterium]|nr:caspase family protein [Ignavibacteriaceae bacterium]
MKMEVPLWSRIVFCLMLVFGNTFAFAQSDDPRPELRLQEGHTLPVSSAVFSPDGRFIVSGSWDQTIKIWETSTGKLIRTLHSDGRGVTSLSISPDGKYIVSGCFDGKIVLWELQTGQIARVIEGVSKVTDVKFSSDEKFIVSSTESGVIKIYLTDSGSLVHNIDTHSKSGTSISISQNGRYIASGSEEGNLSVWDVETGKHMRTIKGHGEDISSVAISGDGDYLVSAAYFDSTIKIWDQTTGKFLRTLKGHTGSVETVTISSDSKYIFSGSEDKTIKIWELTTGKLLHALEGHKDWVTTINISPDRRYMVSGSSDNTIKIWDWKSARLVRTLGGQTSIVISTLITPDNKFFQYAIDNGKIYKWESTSGKVVKTINTDSYRGALAMSKDGRYLVTGVDYPYGPVNIWQLESGELIRSLRGHEEEVRYVAISPDNKYIISASIDGAIKIWENPSGKQHSSYSDYEYGVKIVSFSPDGKYFIYASDSSGKSFIRYREIETGKLVHNLYIDSKPKLLTFTPDGKYVLSVSSEGKGISILEIVRGTIVRRIEDIRVNSVTMSHDGKYIIAGIDDYTIRIWDFATGNPVDTLSGHKHYVTSVAPGSDGRYLLSGSSDGSIRYWDIETGKELLSMYGFDNNDWVSMSPDGRFDGTQEGLKQLHYVQGMDVLPLESFFNEFYTPGLMQQVMASGTVPEFKENIDLTKAVKLPPSAEITSPKTGDRIKSGKTLIDIAVTDHGGGIGKVKIFLNGKLVEEELIGLAEKKGAQIDRVYTVELLADTNRIRVVADNLDGTESAPYELVLQAEGTKPKSTLYILAAGVNNYKNSRYNLSFAVNDIDTLITEISKKGEKIFKEIVVVRLTDTEATRGRLLQSAEELITKVKPSDGFVFLYSGHGVMSEGEKPDFYMVLHNVTQMYGRNDLLAQEGVSSGELKEISRRIRANKQMMIIDACQAGGALETFALRGVTEEKAIQSLARNSGVYVIASSSRDQASKELPKLGMGLFSYAVKEALNCMGDLDGDNMITIAEIDSYAAKRVPELCKLYNIPEQYPMSWKVYQDFPLSVCK